MLYILRCLILISFQWLNKGSTDFTPILQMNIFNEETQLMLIALTLN